MSAVAGPDAHRQLPLESAAGLAGGAAQRAVLRCRADRDALVLEHLHLVDAVVGRLRARRTATTDDDDYRQAGRLALLRAAATWDPSRPDAAAFPTYAWRSVSNAILRLQRAACRRPAAAMLPLDTVLDLESGLTVEETLADPGEQPGDELLQRVHRMHVLTVLSRLPDHDRDLLRARYVNGHPIVVVAALLRLTVGQVQWRLPGATQRFRRAWQHATREDPPARPRRAVSPPASNDPTAPERSLRRVLWTRRPVMQAQHLDQWTPLCVAQAKASRTSDKGDSSVPEPAPHRGNPERMVQATPATRVDPHPGTGPETSNPWGHGPPPQGWVRLDEDCNRVVVWDGDAWRELPPPEGTDPGLWNVLAWKLGRDGELP
jgi:RNA polymerase sigma factor (sigma-70 family)